MALSAPPRSSQPASRELWHLHDRHGPDRRAYSPAAERNCAPILDVLAEWLPERGRVLELGSGTGQHIVSFARRCDRLLWLPSDPESRARESSNAWITHERLVNVAPPIALDARQPDWGFDRSLDAIVAINVVHISPWEVTEGIVRGAGRHLGPVGRLVLYGPYRRHGRHTAPSNEAFDRALRGQDPSWGVRDLEAVERLAVDHGLGTAEVCEMPANNLMLSFSRTCVQ